MPPLQISRALQSDLASARNREIFVLCADIARHAALRINRHIAQYLNLAGETHVGVFLQIAAQPEFLHEGEGVGIGRRGNCYTVGATEAVAMTVEIPPDAAVDAHIVFQRRIAHMIADRHFNNNIFTHKSNRWHELYPPDSYL